MFRSSCFLNGAMIILLNEKHDGTELNESVRTERSPCGTERGHSCLCHSDECARRSVLLSFSKAATWVAPSCHCTIRSENIGTVANTFTCLSIYCGMSGMCLPPGCVWNTAGTVAKLVHHILLSYYQLFYHLMTVLLNADRLVADKDASFLSARFTGFFCLSLICPGKKSPSY